MTAWRRLLLPALTTALMLAVLVGLGVWQLHRLRWKEDLLARLDALEKAAPVPLPQQPRPFQKVRVQGEWLPDKLARYAAEVRQIGRDRLLGAQALMPLRLPDGAVLLVDLGWIPTEGSLPVALPAGASSVVGWLRPSDRPGLFSPPDTPAERRFFTLNAGTIGAALGLTHVLPFVLVELPAGPAGGYPLPTAEIPHPPNNHLGYALTWFGLALVLLVVFGLHVRRTLHPAGPDEARQGVPR